MSASRTVHIGHTRAPGRRCTADGGQAARQPRRSQRQTRSEPTDPLQQIKGRSCDLRQEQNDIVNRYSGGVSITNITVPQRAWVVGYLCVVVDEFVASRAGVTSVWSPCPAVRLGISAPSYAITECHHAMNPMMRPRVLAARIRPSRRGVETLWHAGSPMRGGGSESSLEDIT